MPTKVRYPSLNTNQWTDEPLKVIDQVLLSFFTSLVSQSNDFRNDIASFSFLVQRHKGRTDELAQSIKDTLTSQFEKYFNAVEISTTVEEIAISRHVIMVKGTMQDTSQEVFDIGRIFTMENSSLVKVLKISNG